MLTGVHQLVSHSGIFGVLKRHRGSLPAEAIELNFRFIAELGHMSHFIQDDAPAIEPGNHASPVLTAVCCS